VSEPYSKEDFAGVAALKCECVICPDCKGTGDIKRSLDGFRETERCDNCQGGITETCERCRLLEEMDQDNMEYYERKERAGLL
jgi:DnaJ-class molecular chaperone